MKVDDFKKMSPNKVPWDALIKERDRLYDLPENVAKRKAEEKREKKWVKKHKEIVRNENDYLIYKDHKIALEKIAKAGYVYDDKLCIELVGGQWVYLEWDAVEHPSWGNWFIYNQQTKVGEMVKEFHEKRKNCEHVVGNNYCAKCGLRLKDVKRF